MEKLHLLIVDDDEEVSEFMKLRLGRDAKHFVIDCAYTAEDCLKYLQENKVDCVLCDYQMPSMDGMEMLLYAREKGLDAPFIFVTGQGSEEIAREAFKNGAFDYFTKEIGFAHFARIINSIEQAVRQKHAEKARADAEEAMKKLERQRSDLFAMVSHDIKSPLTAIMGYSDMLQKETAKDQETSQIMSGIRSSCRKINGIMEDFFVVSRLESANYSLEESLCDPAIPLRDAEKDFAAQALGRKLRFRVRIEPGLPEIKADRTFLHRALFNLIQNAFAYTPSGGEVTVSAALGPGEKEIIFSVTDSGPGIPPDEQKKVFEKYYRLHSPAGRKGNGLGLYLVKSVALAHGGRVLLQSEPGKGSTFSIILPV